MICEKCHIVEHILYFSVNSTGLSVARGGLSAVTVHGLYGPIVIFAGKYRVGRGFKFH